MKAALGGLAATVAGILAIAVLAVGPPPTMGGPPSATAIAEIPPSLIPGRSAPARPADAPPDIDNAWDSIYTAALLCADGVTYGIGSSPPSGGRVAAVQGATVPGDARTVLVAALSVLSTPTSGAARPRIRAWTCSGLVHWAYAQAGIVLPRTTYQQVTYGIPVP